MPTGSSGSGRWHTAWSERETGGVCGKVHARSLVFGIAACITVMLLPVMRTGPGAREAARFRARPITHNQQIKLISTADPHPGDPQSAAARGVHANGMDLIEATIYCR